MYYFQIGRTSTSKGTYKYTLYPEKVITHLKSKNVYTYF